MKKSINLLVNLLIISLLVIGCSSNKSDENDRDTSANNVTEEDDDGTDNNKVDEDANESNTTNDDEESKVESLGDYEVQLGGKLIETEKESLLKGKVIYFLDPMLLVK